MAANLDTGMDKKAFLGYPARYEKHPFDTVKLDFFPDRKRNPAVVNIYNLGVLVARCYPLLKGGGWEEQLPRELAFIERNKGDGKVYFVNVYGKVSYTASSLNRFEIN